MYGMIILVVDAANMTTVKPEDYVIFGVSCVNDYAFIDITVVFIVATVEFFYCVCAVGAVVFVIFCVFILSVLLL